VTATGGASGNAVTFRTTSACTVSGAKVSFIGVGKCIIDANQAGDADYLTAAQATQRLQGCQGTSKTTLKLSATKVPYGHEQVENLSLTVLPQHSGSAPTGQVTISESGTRFVHDYARVGQGNVHALVQGAQGRYLPPCRHLRRQHELQGLHFGQGDLHRRQAMSWATTTELLRPPRGEPGDTNRHRTEPTIQVNGAAALS